MLVVIAALAFAAVALAMASLLVPVLDPVQERVRILREERAAKDNDARRPSFAERILRPLTDSLTRRVAAVLPPGLVAQLRHSLTMAGSPMSATAFLSLVMAVSLIFLAVPLMGMMAAGTPWDAKQVLWLVIMMAVGAF